MRAHRHLVLRKETLTELRTAELAAVGGGQDSPLTRIVCVAEPSALLVGVCESLFRPCSYGCPTYTCQPQP